MSDDREFKYCPACGGQRLADEGTVFIEDGPYNGREYANEADFDRYRCLDCETRFGPMPAKLVCTKCGGSVGELGEDCEEDPEHEGGFICQDCMEKEEAQ